MVISWEEGPTLKKARTENLASAIEVVSIILVKVPRTKLRRSTLEVPSKRVAEVELEVNRESFGIGVGDQGKGGEDNALLDREVDYDNDVMDSKDETCLRHRPRWTRRKKPLLRILSEGMKTRIFGFNVSLLEKINYNFLCHEARRQEGLMKVALRQARDLEASIDIEGKDIGGLVSVVENESFWGKVVDSDWDLCIDELSFKLLDLKKMCSQAESEASASLQRVPERDEALAKAATELQSMSKELADARAIPNVF
ncbi:hypothetical protein ACFE04_021888 [Oxalis oulophora]